MQAYCYSGHSRNPLIILYSCSPGTNAVFGNERIWSFVHFAPDERLNRMKFTR